MNGNWQEGRGDTVTLLSAVTFPLVGPEVIKTMNAVQAVGCLRQNINVALMDGVKSDFLQQSVGCEPAGLGSESWREGRCLQALLASADGAQLINAPQLEKH